MRCHVKGCNLLFWADEVIYKISLRYITLNHHFQDTYYIAMVFKIIFPSTVFCKCYRLACVWSCVRLPIERIELIVKTGCNNSTAKPHQIMNITGPLR